MDKETIEIQTDFIKLQQLIKWAGLSETGGEAKDFILDGLVYVNGEVCIQRGKKVYPGDKVRIEEAIELLVEKKA